MTGTRRRTRTAAWRTAWTIGIGALLCTACTAGPEAQGSDGRLNRIIEQFENGDIALAGEHLQVVSLEHNPFRMDDLEAFLGELESEGASRPRLAPLVRLAHEADQEYRHVVKQILDAGAMGIILPQVGNPADATRFVQSMRYPPQRGTAYPEPRGVRGWAPIGAMRVWGLSPNEYAARADVWPLNPDGELLALAMIESREAVANIEAILQVPGISGIIVGPGDLSMALGVGTPAAATTAPEVEEVIETVGAACIRHEALCGIYYPASNIEARSAQGFKLFPLPPIP